MTAPSVSAPPPAAKTYQVGTLRYNQAQLVVLFFWLMWNDFSITLIEQVGVLSGFLMKDHGATNTQIALLGSLGGFVCPWINPWVSTWSDRHRGKSGRRRPFLFYATPFFAFFLAVTPYMPTIYHQLLRHASVQALSAHFPMSGEVLFMGISGFFCGLFNSVVLAIFQYLYWDVVPEPLMGRFQSLSKTVTLIAGFVWSFWIWGLADHHLKSVYVGTSAFCLAVYLISVWRIKEGDYPPPDAHRKGGIAAPFRAYFVECFSQAYYLWIFAASLLFQLGNQGNTYQSYYLHYDLKLDYAALGWSGGWAQALTTGFGLACGFAVGSLTDRFKGVRLMAPCCIALGLIALAGFHFVHDKWTYLYFSCARSLVLFVYGVATGAFTIEIFPREKIGQFCSAQAVFYQVAINLASPAIGLLFDRLQDNRVGYLWTGVFYLLCASAYMKVYRNWRRRHGRAPVPHAG